MLLKLRGGLNSFFVTILLGLLIAAFAIWGIGPNMLANNNQSVATVGDTEIPVNRYYAQVQSRAQQLQSQFGGQMSAPDIIRAFGLQETILQQMIVTAAVTEHMRELGLRAGNDLIREELKGFEGFMLPDGTISKAMIQQALDSNNITRAEFMDDIRRSVSMQHLLSTFNVDNAFPKGFAEALYTYESERRFASMIHIKASELTVPDPTPEELEEYYTLAKSSFMAPERRSYSYLLITPKMFEDKVSYTDEDIQYMYDGRHSDYVIPEKRELLQVGFDTEAAANAFIMAVNSGADFVEAATSVTKFTEEEIKLGSFTKSEIESDFNTETATTVFAVEGDGMAGPLPAFSGFNVFKVVGITAGKTTALAEVKDELIADFRREEAINLMFDYLPELEDALANDPRLNALAETLDLNLATVTGVDNRGTRVDGQNAVTQQSEARILSTAFQTEIGIEPTLLDVDPQDNTAGVFLLTVDDVAPTAEQDLEAVKMQVMDAWKAEQKTAKAGELIEKARERLSFGEQAETITEDLGGISFDAKNVVRTGGENTSLSENIRGLIFDVAVGETGSEKASDGDGYIAIRVKEVIPGDPAANKAAVEAKLAGYNSGFQDELLAQYQAYLLQEYKAVVNRPMIEQLFSNTASE